MVWGLILFLALVVFVAVFVGFNLSNTCTFWLFHTFTDVPVSLLVFGAFAAGIIFSILVIIAFKLKNTGSKEKRKEPEVQKEKKARINKKKSLLKKAEKAEAELNAGSSSEAVSVSENQ